MTAPADLPLVTVFSLGGTISSTKPTSNSNSEGVVARLNANDLVEAVPELSQVAELATVAFRQMASSDLSLSDMVELASDITKRFENSTSGVVVTQGTDTLEETSFALDLLIRADRPVVVTGAMRNPTLPGADGPANLLGAVQVAASARACGLGALVVFNDEIHAARFVRKTHASNAATFRSPTVGPLGWISEGQVRIPLRVSALAGVVSGPIDKVPAVALLTSSLGDDLRLIRSLQQMGYCGVVIDAFGGGHVASKAVGALEELAQQMPVVFASRTGAGEVLKQTYGFAGSERDLLSRGLISAGFLDARKARILLSLLLATNMGLDGVSGAFDQINLLS